MQSQQNNYLIALSAQTELLNGLADRLDGWSDLIVAGDNEGLAQSLNPTVVRELLSDMARSRTALSMIQRSSKSADESSGEVTAAFAAARERITRSTDQVRILIQRGLLFTNAMLNCIVGQSYQSNQSDSPALYDVLGQRAMAAGAGLRQEV